MKAVAIVSAFGLLAASLPALVGAADEGYAGSSYRQVWNQVASDRYAELPQDEVTLGAFYDRFRDKLLESSRRTLSDRSDLLPRFQKLVHPNGVCLAGTWNITAATPWTGYFRQGSRALFIARASTATSATKQGEYRAFGFAGKLFPTLDPNAVVPTANFFTIEDLGGTLKDHYLDALNTNDILRVSPTPAALSGAGILLAVARAFAIADRALDPTQIAERQLYWLAEAGEANQAQARGPRWIKLVGAAEVPRVSAADFRDELALANYPGGLRFEIWAADGEPRGADKAWQRIGTIAFTDGAASDSCDHRLHFAHPPFRSAN